MEASNGETSSSEPCGETKRDNANSEEFYKKAIG